MQQRITVFDTTRRWLSVAALTSLAAFFGCATQPPTVPPGPTAEQQQLIADSQTTVSHFLRDPDMTWFQQHLGQARAVLVSPQVVKAGFIFGGSGGRAVLYTRNPQSGGWSGPAFYNLGAASVGFQAGVSVSETVVLVMTEKGLNSLMSPSFKLGADASIAVGPVGAGAGTDITSDFVGFSRSKGVYGGLNLEGGVISVADDWNNAYYGRVVSPVDIAIRGNVRGPAPTGLANELDRATARRTSSAQ
jgi:lipid-binding SYLF domain-containing protein